jgi:hypothetical protein
MNEQPDTKPGFYYVSVVRTGGLRHDFRLLRGPFQNDHAAALAAVEPGKARAEALDPRAFWYAYGTCRTDTDQGPGILDRIEAEKAAA